MYYLSYELVSKKRYKLTCGPIEDSNWPVHQGRLIRVFDESSLGSQGFDISSGGKLRI